jgi:hypothetical protein
MKSGRNAAVIVSSYAKIETLQKFAPYLRKKSAVSVLKASIGIKFKLSLFQNMNKLQK